MHQSQVFLHRGPYGPVFGGVQTTLGTDQPAHPHRLISAFVIRFLKYKLVTSEIHFSYLVSVAQEIGLRTGFVTLRSI